MKPAAMSKHVSGAIGYAKSRVAREERLARLDAEKTSAIEQIHAELVEAARRCDPFCFRAVVDALGLKDESGLRRRFRDRYGATAGVLYRRLSEVL